MMHLGTTDQAKGYNMTDNDTASQKALEIIILARAKQQAYQLLAQTAVHNTADYWNKANEAYQVMRAQIGLAIETGLLGYDDANVWALKLVDTGAQGDE